MKDTVDTKFCLYFECSEETAFERVMERAISSPIKREDDTEEVLKKRFVTYVNDT